MKITNDRFLSIRLRESLNATLTPDERAQADFTFREIYPGVTAGVAKIYCEAQAAVRQTQKTAFGDDASKKKAMGKEGLMRQLMSDMRNTEEGARLLAMAQKSGMMGMAFIMPGRAKSTDFHPYTFRGDADNLSKGTQDQMFTKKNDRCVYRYWYLEAYGAPMELQRPIIVIGSADMDPMFNDRSARNLFIDLIEEQWKS